jgi:hypothetical protein
VEDDVGREPPRRRELHVPFGPRQANDAIRRELVHERAAELAARARD